MRTIHRLIEAKKAQREEEGNEAGFSLIELIIVVVILGILVAIAIPLIGNITTQARESAVKAVAQNAAVQWSSQIAAGTVPTDYVTNDTKVTVTGKPAATVKDPNTVCASAVNSDIATGLGSAGTPAKAGPGC